MTTSLDYQKQISSVLRVISNLRKKHVPDSSGTISIPETHLRILNECRYGSKDNTVLMIGVELGRTEDVDFLLKIKGFQVNRRNKVGETAADISWNMKNYNILWILLINDSFFPKEFSLDKVDTEELVKENLKRLVEERETLHEWIRNGDLKAIEEFMKKKKPSVFYTPDNVTASYRVLEQKKKEMFSLLSCIRPNFKISNTEIENIQWAQNKEKKHVLKLVQATRFVEEPEKEEWEAIIRMYLKLDKQPEISSLMKAIEHENFEIYFEIKSKIGNPKEVKVKDAAAYGFTKLDGRIYIGGLGITTEERYRVVHGVFAHEICHLAMLLMYDNCWNPYHHGDKKRKKEFTKIRDLYEKKEGIDEVIKDAYELYNKAEWEGELIVRVPEIIGRYDKKKADDIFKNQILKLHNYYKNCIIPDCEEFSKPDFHTEPLRQIKELSKYHGVVRGEDKCMSPFKENFLKKNKYNDYLFPLPPKYKYRNVRYCTTSNPKLFAMHFFHEEKLNLPIHAEKRCLAFNLECCINGKFYKTILEALKSEICTTLILLVMKKESAWEDKIIDLKKVLTEEKQVIIVTLTDICKELPESKRLNYQWNDLSEDYRDGLLQKSIKYQGQSKSLNGVVECCKDPQVMKPDELWHIMSQDELSIGEDIISTGNEGELYVERTFVRFVYKEENFQTEQMPSHYLFLTGVEQSKLPGNSKKWSQMISNDDYEIEKEKYIFMTKNKKNYSDLFKKLCSKIEDKSKQVFWIHRTNGKYLLRDWLGRSEDIENHFEEETFVEDQMLEKTVGMSVVLVAGEPGAGKSTSIHSLREKMKKMYPEKLILRVNFSEHLHEFDASPTPESLIEFLQRICNMNNPLEKMAFKSFIGIRQRIVVFFDGFDEMTKDFQSKAIESLQLLREKTKIQMWIFTRKYDRLTLEEEMNNESFSLKEFSDDDQCKYFNQFWKSQLISLKQGKDFDNTFQEIVKNLEHSSGKCEQLLKSMKKLVNLIEEDNQEEFIKKINDLDFSDYSKLVIKSIKDNILKGEFIVPLWLWMMGNIILCSDLKIPDHRNRYEFYSDFMKKKVNYHLKEKRKLSPGSAYQDYNSIKEKIFRILWKFSVRVMQSEHYEEISDLEYKNLQELVHVGLLRKVGEGYDFFHKTFAEFLFSQMFVEEIKSGKLHSVDEKLLSDVLLEDSYREVRIFLDDFLEKDDRQSLVDDFIKKKSFVFPKSLLQEFKLFEIYCKFCIIINDRRKYEFCNRMYYRTGDWIWKRIFKSCEIHMKESVNAKSILNVLNISPFNNSKYYLNGVLDVLNSTFTDTMLFNMFESRLDESCEFLFRCLFSINSNDLNAIMSIFKKIINYKKSHLRSEVPSTSNSLVNVKVGLELFEKEYKDEGGNSVLHLMMKNIYERVLEDLREIQSMIGNDRKLNQMLTMQNGVGRTMLHILMEYSEDPKDVISVLEFVEGVMEGESFKQFLIKKDNKERFPISYANLHIMKDMLVFMGRYFSNQDIRNMLRENEVRLGKSIRLTDRALEEILYLEELLGIELYHEILISKDKNGGTRLHYMMFRMRADKLFSRDLKVYTSFLDRDSMRAFLFSQDGHGYTFLHKWAISSRGSQSIDIFHELHSILSPDVFEELINIRNKEGRTFIDEYHNPLSELFLIYFLDKYLGKEKLIKLVTDKDNKYGFTRLHFIKYLAHVVAFSPWAGERLHEFHELLLKDLEFYSKLLDESLFRDFILTKNNWGETFCFNYNLRDLNKLKGILSPDLFLELRKIVKKAEKKKRKKRNRTKIKTNANVNI